MNNGQEDSCSETDFPSVMVVGHWMMSLLINSRYTLSQDFIIAFQLNGEALTTSHCALPMKWAHLEPSCASPLSCTSNVLWKRTYLCMLLFMLRQLFRIKKIKVRGGCLKFLFYDLQNLVTSDNSVPKATKAMVHCGLSREGSTVQFWSELSSEVFKYADVMLSLGCLYYLFAFQSVPFVVNKCESIYSQRFRYCAFRYYPQPRLPLKSPPSAWGKWLTIIVEVTTNYSSAWTEHFQLLLYSFTFLQMDKSF